MAFAPFSIFYFFYFALLGLIAPYMGLYLADQGFSLLEIAQLTSIFLITKIVAPNIWGALADHYQCRLLLVRAGTVATFWGYLLFFQSEGFWQYAMTIVLFSFFWNAVLPQFEVITLYNLAEYRNRYSQVRLWGSIGFIASVAGAGFVIEIYSIALFPWLMLGVISALALCSWWQFSEPRESVSRDAAVSFWLELAQRPIVLFFVACFLLQLSHGAYYTYFSLFLEQFGYSESTIGLLWALGVLAEVLLFMVMHHWLKRQNVRSIMLIALSVTALRWLLTVWLVESVWLLALIQCCHAMSFGAMHACSIQFVHGRFSGANQGKAQALYSSVGFGAGGALGAYISGCMVEWFDYAQAFYLCAFFAVLAWFAILRQR